MCTAACIGIVPILFRSQTKVICRCVTGLQIIVELHLLFTTIEQLEMLGTQPYVLALCTDVSMNVV